MTSSTNQTPPGLPDAEQAAPAAPAASASVNADSMLAKAQQSQRIWFYEQNGERKGGVNEATILQLIRNKMLTYGSLVWHKGQADWIKVEDSELNCYLSDTQPPPITGEHAKNGLVWTLAFAPLLGYMLEWFIGGLLYKSEVGAEAAVESGKFFLVTVVLNIVLSTLDEKQLKKGGVDTKSFGSMFWLVPVYLYKRAVHLKQTPSYFWVWIACFVLVLSA